jgi:hypothetical protein
MDVLPCTAKSREVFPKRSLNPHQIARGEAVVLTQRNWAQHAVQSKYRLMILPNDVHMGWTVVIWIDDDSKCANPHNGWHGIIIA